MIRLSFACALALSLAVTALAACGDDGGTPAIDAATAIDAPVAAQTCANYCSTITANCGAANTMYTSEATCLATCAGWQPGTAADMSGNTLGCRIYHAGVAAGNPGLHCRHAGPGGDGVCGANCEGFCTLAMRACTGQPTPPYASISACMTTCAGFATTPPYDATQTAGNTFACRLYHATAASTAPAIHCAHLGMSSPPCS